MKIQSCYLENVRGLPSMRLDFVDPVSQQVRQRTVIAGSNGSGKTTILESIGELLGFANFQRLKWVQLSDSSGRLVVTELPPDTARELAIESNSDNSKQIKYIGPVLSTIDAHHPIGNGANSGDITILGLASQITKLIRDAKEKSGGYPNCIYFPSEKRQLQKKEVGEVVAEPSSYEWVYRFDDSQKWRGSLESFISSLYWRDLQTWYDESKETNDHKTNGHKTTGHDQGEFSQFVKTINRFLSGKQIQGVDRQTFRVLVETDRGIDLSFDQLSSGEKQIILLLGELQRRIQHGSVVLIDEPEIHLHPRWQRMLMQALTDLCDAYDAQLIITTQSEEIANSVYEHELLLLDDIFESDSAEAETLHVS